ncbi:MAG: hypothetical protein ACRDBM_05590, partial [Sporomusa sp.]
MIKLPEELLRCFSSKTIKFDCRYMLGIKGCPFGIAPKGPKGLGRRLQKAEKTGSIPKIRKLSAPVRCLLYSRCEADMVRVSHPPLSSLGVEVVTPDLSVGR